MGWRRQEANASSDKEIRGAQSLMREEINQTDPSTPGTVNLRPTIGCFGLILFPIAIVLYLIALPFVGALWVLEFFLPRHPWEMPIDDPTPEPPVQIPEHGLKDLKPR